MSEKSKPNSYLANELMRQLANQGYSRKKIAFEVPLISSCLLYLPKMMKTFVITGPEASGKTTLSVDLASGLNGHLIPEYARWYLPTLYRPYNFNDLLAICRGQEREMLMKRDGAAGKDLMFIDTWVLVLMVWAEYRFGKSHPCFEALLYRYPVHHYFLCTPDIPWEEGPLRENPFDRDVLFEMYLKKLRHFDLPFTVLAGNQDKRIADAKEIIESLS